jgi:hypothetical protein
MYSKILKNSDNFAQGKPYHDAIKQGQNMFRRCYNKVRGKKVPLKMILNVILMNL